MKKRSQAIGGLGWLGFLSLASSQYALLEHTRWFLLLTPLWAVPPVIGALESRGYWDNTQSVDSADEPTAWIRSGYRLGPISTVLSLLVSVQPIVASRSLLQTGAGYVALRRYRDDDRPSPERDSSDIEYRLPFDGEWTVGNGSPDQQHSHSWSIPQQRYAYDFVITDEEGRTHDGGTGPDAHYCFGTPVRAPAAGTVVETADGHRDYHRTTGWRDPLQYRLHGNYVILEHSESEYSVLSHLQCGSVCVTAGDHVAQGDRIGRCGHSGNSTEPHLHYQLQDRPHRYLAVGLPIEFTDTITRRPDDDGTHHRTTVHCGDLVSVAPAGACDSPETADTTN